jgi:hypothetical protein
MRHLLAIGSGQWRSIHVNRVSQTNTLKNEISLVLSWLSGTHILAGELIRKYFVCHLHPPSHKIFGCFLAAYVGAGTIRRYMIWGNLNAFQLLGMSSMMLAGHVARRTHIYAREYRNILSLIFI